MDSAKILKVKDLTDITLLCILLKDVKILKDFKFRSISKIYAKGRKLIVKSPNV